jgi:hypothetical protein
MKRLWGIAQDIVFSWLPFAFASYLSISTLSHIARTELRAWEPAFFSFLPMCFFFAGVVGFATRMEIRKLRETVAVLRASSSS